MKGYDHVTTVGDGGGHAEFDVEKVGCKDGSGKRGGGEHNDDDDDDDDDERDDIIH